MTRSESNARPCPPAAVSPTGVTHVRHRHDTHFTVVGNHLALHPTLSAVAIGLAVRIQALADGAHVSIRALSMQLPETEYRIARALKELEVAGYLERRRERAPGQRIVPRPTYYDPPGTRPEPGTHPLPTPRPPEPAGDKPPPAPPQEPPPQEPPPDEPPPDEPPPDDPLPDEPPPAPRPQPVDTPEPAPEPAPEPGPGPGPESAPDPHPEHSPAPAPALIPTPATDLLASLRLVDARLTLSVRDVSRLAPAVVEWLDRGVPPANIVRTLASALPLGTIFRPAALLEHRLTEWLPPPLPVHPVVPGTSPGSAGPAPVRVCCTGCDRPFVDPAPPGSQDPPVTRCRACRTQQPVAEEEPPAPQRPSALRNVQAPHHLKTGAAASVRSQAARARNAAATAGPR
ncbi:hypothetical protein [Streptomyces sp. WAC 06783]|uniref:hypothetical protein n=1 Tax=Streptomyces sp. WAC 06783 TaxID=2203211 RepID=UPI000F748322|nr:hypothetical protein [Streptomyces sp. WAC 06783]